MLEQGRSKNSVIKELHVSSTSLDVWYAQYKKGGVQSFLQSRRLSFKEKKEIVDDIENNGLSLSGASRKYCVSIMAISRWVERLGSKSGADDEEIRLASEYMAKKKAYTAEQLDELEMLRRRNEYLEAENALLKKVKALVEEREARLREIGRKPSKD